MTAKYPSCVTAGLIWHCSSSLPDRFPLGSAGPETAHTSHLGNVRLRSCLLPAVGAAEKTRYGSFSKSAEYRSRPPFLCRRLSGAFFAGLESCRRSAHPGQRFFVRPSEFRIVLCEGRSNTSLNRDKLIRLVV